jgi:hypothetical protein
VLEEEKAAAFMPPPSSQSYEKRHNNRKDRRRMTKDMEELDPMDPASYSPECPRYNNSSVVAAVHFLFARFKFRIRN